MLLRVRWVTELRQMCGQRSKLKTTHLKRKLCVCWGDPGDGANMSPQDRVVVASCPNWRAWAFTQNKWWARLQKGALLFNRWHLLHLGSPFFMPLKHENLKCACRYGHAHDWKKKCSTHKNRHRYIYSSSPHKAADVWKFPVQSWHQVVRSITQGVCHENFQGCWTDITGNDQLYDLP